MLALIPFAHGNTNRYGRPWVAVISWHQGAKPSFDFAAGRYDGHDLVVECEPGDVLCYGQKDYRKIHHSVRQYAIVRADGGIDDVTEGSARTHWRETREKR